MRKRKLPFKKAVIWILLSTFLISGTTTAIILYYSHLKTLQESDERYNIVAIVQMGSDKGILKTEYLAETLGLSVDQPCNLYCFNLKEGKKKLLASPLIKDVVIKRVKPGTLSIRPSVRKPIAFVGDFSNTAIDDEGVFIPFKPFFSPKKIPEIILGNLDACVWGEGIEGNLADLTLTTLHEILSLPTSSEVKKIDFSRAELPSYGQREIVVHLSYPDQTRFLRLSRDHISQQLANYTVLEKELNGKPFEKETLVVDLRIPKLGFIE